MLKTAFLFSILLLTLNSFGGTISGPKCGAVIDAFADHLKLKKMGDADQWDWRGYSKQFMGRLFSEALANSTLEHQHLAIQKGARCYLKKARRGEDGVLGHPSERDARSIEGPIWPGMDGWLVSDSLKQRLGEIFSCSQEVTSAWGRVQELSVYPDEYTPAQVRQNKIQYQARKKELKDQEDKCNKMEDQFILQPEDRAAFVRAAASNGCLQFKRLSPQAIEATFRKNSIPPEVGQHLRDHDKLQFTGEPIFFAKLSEKHKFFVFRDGAGAVTDLEFGQNGERRTVSLDKSCNITTASAAGRKFSYPSCKTNKLLKDEFACDSKFWAKTEGISESVPEDAAPTRE